MTYQLILMIARTLKGVAVTVVHFAFVAVNAFFIFTRARVSQD